MSTCKGIDKLVCNFIWNKGESWGLNLVNWKVVTFAKSHGELGVHQAKLTNIAMLGKLVAEFVGNSPKLWIDLLRQKYGDLDNIVVTSNGSPTWKALVRTYQVLRASFFMCLSKGHILFWYDKWLL